MDPIGRISKGTIAPVGATFSGMGSAITVRRPSFDGWGELPRHWYGGQPFASHFLDALSSVFPVGEAFFVRSVLHYRDRIDDPELQIAIRAFAGQEGQHSQQHARHAERLLQQGYTGLGWRNRLADRIMQWSLRRTPRASLAATVALEHLTAILARRLLCDPERWTAPMDPRIAPLWLWHALEEAEHKAVAFDVLAKVAPSHALRVIQLAQNTVGLFVEIMDRTVYMLWKDGLLFRRDVWADGLRFLFGRHGFLRGLGPDYWPFYRRDFHPNDVDDGPLLELERERLEGLVA
jgi:predicted metal-dependent hydrolase